MLRLPWLHRERSSVESDRPIGFGYKMSWLAIRCDAASEVVQALSLSHVHAVTWRKGIDSVYGSMRDRDVLVTPPVDGWVLVVGWWVGGDGSEALVGSMSRRFGEAQAFYTHRVSEAHGWMCAQNGRVTRSFAVGDGVEILDDRGDRTPVENTFDWTSYLASVNSEGHDETASHDDDDQLWSPDEEAVMQVASAWSVNPTTLGERQALGGPLLLGRVPGKLTVELARRLVG